ncbi:MAG: RNA polymerase sigma factor [Myxococcales bacterium]
MSALPQASTGPATAVPDFATVYRDHVQLVARWAAKLGGPYVDVEDAVQETFAIVQRRLPSYRPEAKLTTWLFRITENAVHHQRRSARWRRFLRGSAEEAAGDRPDPRRSPLEDVEHRQAREKVYRILDRMNPRYRTALVLARLEELPTEEVAERMGMSRDNLWLVLHRARKDFARRLAELEGDGDG